MQTSSAGLALIKEHEGLRLDAYLCPARVWTIGYGHTGDVHPGQRITEAMADLLLQSDLKSFERAVNAAVKVPLTQGQFDALVSFAFNVGAGAFRLSTLLRVLNEGDYRAAAKQFDRWVHGGGKVLPGLVRRRRDERARSSAAWGTTAQGRPGQHHRDQVPPLRDTQPKKAMSLKASASSADWRF